MGVGGAGGREAAGTHGAILMVPIRMVGVRGGVRVGGEAIRIHAGDGGAIGADGAWAGERVVRVGVVLGREVGRVMGRVVWVHARQRRQGVMHPAGRDGWCRRTLGCFVGGGDGRGRGSTTATCVGRRGSLPWCPT